MTVSKNNIPSYLYTAYVFYSLQNFIFSIGSFLVDRHSLFVDETEQIAKIKETTFDSDYCNSGGFYQPFYLQFDGKIMATTTHECASRENI